VLMGMIWRFIHVTGRKLRQPAFLILAALIGWTSSTQLFACTNSGIHCPTAPIQSVTVANLSCCGKVIIFTSRKPRPGEKGFVQCRCAEKRSAQQQAGIGATVPHLDMMASQAFVLHLPLRISEPTVPSFSLNLFPEVTLVPFIPPPSFA
jgi:hypothetical protein